MPDRFEHRNRHDRIHAASHSRCAQPPLRRRRSPSTKALSGLDELPASPAAACTGAIPSAPVDPDLLRLLCACALSAPSKSDLQQADIVIVEQGRPGAIADLIPDQPFIRTAPAFLVFLANGRRLPEIAKMRGKPFPNDHLDQFFNAAVDAGIVLATFIARRRRGRARHLPDQRDPRSFGQGERDARSCRSGLFRSPGCASAGRRRRATSAARLRLRQHGA